MINLDNVKVVNYRFISQEVILIELKSCLDKVPCPHCKNLTGKVHQNHHYRARDIPLSDFQVFLEINRRRFQCEQCHKVFSEELGWLKTRRTYTVRLGKKWFKRS